MIEKNDPRLTAYVLGELDESEKLEIESAIESSSEIRNAVQGIRSTCNSVEDAFAQELSDSQNERVLKSRIDVGSTNQAANTNSRWSVWAAAVSIAVLGMSIMYLVIPGASHRNHKTVELSGGISGQSDLDFSQLEDQIAKTTDGESEYPPNLSMVVPQDENDDDGFTFYTPATPEMEPGKGFATRESEIASSELRDPAQVTKQQLLLPNQALEDKLAEDENRPAEYLSGGEVPMEIPSDQARQKLLERMQEIQSRKQEVFFERLVDVDEDVFDSAEDTSVEFLSGGEIPIEVARDPSKIQEYLARAELEAKLESRRVPRREKEAELRANFSGEDDRSLSDRGIASETDELSRSEIESFITSSIVPGTNVVTLTGSPEIVEKVQGYLAELSDEDLTELLGQSLKNKQIDTSDAREIANAFRAAMLDGKDDSELQKIQQQEVQFLTQMLRANFDLDNQISNAEKQYQDALQRFNTDHPYVKSMKAQLEVWKQFKKDVSKKYDIVEQRLNEAEKKGMPPESVAKLRKLIAQKRRESKPKSWRKVEATGNTSRLIIGDKDELDLNGMQVQVQVDGFRARVLVDYFYYNDRDRQLEGNFKIRLPDDASLYYFAFGQSAYDFSPDDGLAQGEFTAGNDQYVSLHPAEIGLARQDAWKNVKESRMVPREKAAFAYSQTVRRRVDPALVEWSGAGIFNARVFPLFPQKLHRIVIGYDVNLTSTSDGMAYRLDLPEQMGECRVDVNVTDFANGKWELQLDKLVDGSKPDATQWESDQAPEHVRSQKRMRFESPNWRSLTLKAKHDHHVILQSPKREKGPFFATQLKVDLEDNAQLNNDSAIFLVDTSLSSRPEKFNVWLDLMKSTLENNRGDLRRFAVMFFDVECRFWKTGWTENSDASVKSLMQDCFQIGLEGATNLHGAVLELGDAEWVHAGNARPDVFLLSDGAANWGETSLRLIQNEFVSLNVGSLFAYQTGRTGTAIANLRSLAGSTGGAVFSVTSEDEVETASTAHRSKPWKLESVVANGAKDLMTAGRIEWIYPGQLVTIVGRGHIQDQLQIVLSQGDQKKTVTVDDLVSVESELASRLYGHVSVGQLESLGESVFDVSAAYARHFRITGNTCSLLMLESEADYQRFDIKPQEDWFVVQSKSASKIVDDTLEKMAQSLADPKSQLATWIARLEKMPGLEFKMPTALKLAMDQMTIKAIDSRLDIEMANREDWSKKYVKELTRNTLDPNVIGVEMERRRAASVDSALRAYSNLIESNPGDWVATRDVAFTAMDLDRPAAAYHLLRRVIQSRPYDGSTYAALGQCLDQLNEGDLAMVYYELALGAKFQNQGADFHKIVATHYRSLLNRIVRGDLASSAKDYAIARADSLNKVSTLEKSDIVISMMWNTDQTDVDLHVIEPSGEECFYQHRETAAGGQITTDKTDGFGPEMYSIATAPNGEYKVSVKYFGSNQNRTKVTNKIYLTIYENFGSENERKTRDMITLSKVGSKEQVKTIKWQSD